jgi:hypothetical protein
LKDKDGCKAKDRQIVIHSNRQTGTDTESTGTKPGLGIYKLFHLIFLDHRVRSSCFLEVFTVEISQFEVGLEPLDKCPTFIVLFLTIFYVDGRSSVGDGRSSVGDVRSSLGDGRSSVR